jgi:hypothetical protein
MSAVPHPGTNRVVPQFCTTSEKDSNGHHGDRGTQEAFPLIKQVNDDRAAVEIISNNGRAYLVAAYDCRRGSAPRLRPAH